MLSEGTTLGGYRLLRLLGKGGMCCVYEAEDLEHARRVALKVLPPELGRDAARMRRFFAEIRRTSRLNHDGIIKIYESGGSDGHQYFAMHLLSGGSLEPKIKAGVSKAFALQVVRELAWVLAHAHDRGVIHRDIKPQNILFDDAGRVVLTDFGVSRSMAGRTSQGLTTKGMSPGTPRYMSPEQATGSRKLDGRSDLYSLGVVLFEMLAGHCPYEGGDPFSILYQHIHAPVPKLPAGHERLQPLIDETMAKKPADRIQTARSLGQQLDTLARAA